VYRGRDSHLGFSTELENLSGDAKGEGTSGETARPKVPMHRLGADCFVVVMKRGNARGAKGAGHRRWGWVNRERDEPDIQRKAAAFMRWHEPYKSRGLRTVVATSNAGVFSRRQTCQGKSQEPRSSDGRMAETKISEVLKAHRQGLPWGDYESPGRNDGKRKCGLESEEIRGSSPQP
jgi:hypothetical protein